MQKEEVVWLEGRVYSILTAMLCGDLNIATQVETWAPNPRPTDVHSVVRP